MHNTFFANQEKKREKNLSLVDYLLSKCVAVFSLVPILCSFLFILKKEIRQGKTRPCCIHSVTHIMYSLVL